MKKKRFEPLNFCYNRKTSVYNIVKRFANVYEKKWFRWVGYTTDGIN